MFCLRGKKFYIKLEKEIVRPYLFFVVEEYFHYVHQIFNVLELWSYSLNQLKHMKSFKTSIAIGYYITHYQNKFPESLYDLIDLY